VSGPEVTVEHHAGHVGLVCLHRPPNNYFDTALIEAVAEAYEELAGSEWCRAIVLASEGRHFCAGLDFAGNADQDIAAAGSPSRPTSGWRHRRAASPPTSPAWASTTASR
jgi:enoyl-CoA hydratase/carnithine racemase